MNRQERFSLRKYKFGVASVLLGAVLVFGSAQASAEEQAAGQTSAGTQLVHCSAAPAETESQVQNYEQLLAKSRFKEALRKEVAKKHCS